MSKKRLSKADKREQRLEQIRQRICDIYAGASGEAASRPKADDFGSFMGALSPDGFANFVGAVQSNLLPDKEYVRQYWHLSKYDTLEILAAWVRDTEEMEAA